MIVNSPMNPTAACFTPNQHTFLPGPQVTVSPPLAALSLSTTPSAFGTQQQLMGSGNLSHGTHGGSGPIQRPPPGLSLSSGSHANITDMGGTFDSTNAPEHLFQRSISPMGGVLAKTAGPTSANSSGNLGGSGVNDSKSRGGIVRKGSKQPIQLPVPPLPPFSTPYLFPHPNMPYYHQMMQQQHMAMQLGKGNGHDPLSVTVGLSHIPLPMPNTAPKRGGARQASNQTAAKQTAASATGPHSGNGTPSATTKGGKKPLPSPPLPPAQPSSFIISAGSHPYPDPAATSSSANVHSPPKDPHHPAKAGSKKLPSTPIIGSDMPLKVTIGSSTTGLHHIIHSATGGIKEGSKAPAPKSSVTLSATAAPFVLPSKHADPVTTAMSKAVVSPAVTASSPPRRLSDTLPLPQPVTEDVAKVATVTVPAKNKRKEAAAVARAKRDAAAPDDPSSPKLTKAAISLLQTQSFPSPPSKPDVVDTWIPAAPPMDGTSDVATTDFTPQPDMSDNPLLVAQAPLAPMLTPPLSAPPLTGITTAPVLPSNSTAFTADKAAESGSLGIADAHFVETESERSHGAPPVAGPTTTPPTVTQTAIPSQAVQVPPIVDLATLQPILTAIPQPQILQSILVPIAGPDGTITMVQAYMPITMPTNSGTFNPYMFMMQGLQQQQQPLVLSAQQPLMQPIVLPQQPVMLPQHLGAVLPQQATTTDVSPVPTTQESAASPQQ